MNINSPVEPVNRPRASAAALYDRMSRWYDWLAGPSEIRLQRLGLSLLAVSPGETVLEIGYGTGRCVVELARAVGASGKVNGIDLSTGMRAVATARVVAAGLMDRVELLCQDAIRLPFDAGQIDAIFMSFTLELFETPDIPVLLGECRRALRAAGRLGVVAMAQTPRRHLAVRLYELAHRRWPGIVDCRPIPVAAIMTAAGFHIAHSERHWLWGLPVDVLLARTNSGQQPVSRLTFDV